MQVFTKEFTYAVHIAFGCYIDSYDLVLTETRRKSTHIKRLRSERWGSISRCVAYDWLLQSGTASISRRRKCCCSIPHIHTGIVDSSFTYSKCRRSILSLRWHLWWNLSSLFDPKTIIDHHSLLRPSIKVRNVVAIDQNSVLNLRIFEVLDGRERLFTLLREDLQQRLEKFVTLSSDLHDQPILIAISHTLLSNDCRPLSRGTRLESRWSNKMSVKIGTGLAIDHWDRFSNFLARAILRSATTC